MELWNFTHWSTTQVWNFTHWNFETSNIGTSNFETLNMEPSNLELWHFEPWKSHLELVKTLHDFHEIRKKGWRFASRPGFIYCFPLAKWSFGAPRPTKAPHPRARSPCCFAVITITTIGAYTRGFIFIPLGTKRDSKAPGGCVQNWSASRLQGDLLKDRCFEIVWAARPRLTVGHAWLWYARFGPPAARCARAP